MKIRMLKDYKAAPDRFHTVLLQSGESYDLPDFLAIPFVENKIATYDLTGIIENKIIKEIEPKEKNKTNKKRQ